MTRVPVLTAGSKFKFYHHHYETSDSFSIKESGMERGLQEKILVMMQKDSLMLLVRTFLMVNIPPSCGIGLNCFMIMSLHIYVLTAPDTCSNGSYSGTTMAAIFG